MTDLTKHLEMRIAARGPNGEKLSLLTGGETAAELRNLTIFLCQACPAGQNHLHCPFRVMSGLSYHAMTHLVKSLPHASCLNLLELELTCRSQGEAACQKNLPPT